jgi:hypothetical protein
MWPLHALCLLPGIPLAHVGIKTVVVAGLGSQVGWELGNPVFFLLLISFDKV